MTDYVYFAEADNGFVKIGKSKNIRKRIAELRSSSPIPLRLLHVIDCYGLAAKIERQFHGMFKSKLHHGEWYRLTLKDKMEITKIDTDGMFSVVEVEGEDPICPDCLKSTNGKRGLMSHKPWCNGLPAEQPRRVVRCE